LNTHGQILAKKELTNINNLVEEYLQSSFQKFKAKDKSFAARLITHYDEALQQVPIIPQEIGRVLINLYNNAFYSLSKHNKIQTIGYEPTIIVCTGKLNGRAFISIRDNGPGISVKLVQKIFQPFFTTKPTGQGTGLGLSLSYDIVKAHGGELKVNSIENEFAEFIVELPI
jgi:two-component system NtrC family sensor kinase